MQKLDYTSGFQKIPDKIYSDQEIQAFYDADLAAEVANDEELYNTPPDYDLYEELLDPAPLNVAVGMVVACTMYSIFSFFKRGTV